MRIKHFRVIGAESIEPSLGTLFALAVSRPLLFRCPPGVNLAGQDFRSYGTLFSASEVQQFGANDKEESWRELLYSF
jgi:hypothetical protein